MVVALLLNHALQNLCKIKGTPETCNLITHVNTRKDAFDLVTSVGLILL